MTTQEDHKSSRYLFDSHLAELMDDTDVLYRKIEYLLEIESSVYKDKSQEELKLSIDDMKESAGNIFHEICLIKEALLILHNTKQESTDIL